MARAMPGKLRCSTSVLIAALLLSATPALSEGRPPPETDTSKACSPSDRLQRTDRGPSSPTTGEDVSDKLARTEGVICPPDVDPGIKAPTPEAGTMPIIPPPGSPGGDQSVRPK